MELHQDETKELEIENSLNIVAVEISYVSLELQAPAEGACPWFQWRIGPFCLAALPGVASGELGGLMDQTFLPSTHDVTQSRCDGQ